MIFSKNDGILCFYIEDIYASRNLPVKNRTPSDRYVKYKIPYANEVIFMTYDIIFHGSVGYNTYNDRLWEIES
jgi:hypothetical protein